MYDHNRRSAPDYTQACVAMFSLNIAWIFMAVWIIWGFGPVLVLALFVNHGMTRLQAFATAQAEVNRRSPRAKAHY